MPLDFKTHTHLVLPIPTTTWRRQGQTAKKSTKDGRSSSGSKWLGLKLILIW